MSAVSSSLGSGPDGVVVEVPKEVLRRRRGVLRSLPLKAKIGAVILGVFIVVAIVGPWVAPYDPSATTPGQALPLGPTWSHLLGTTATGQDVLSQLLSGTRSTVVLGLLTGVIATLLSVVVGTSAGFLGGVADEGLSLVANVFLVLPALPLLVVILGYLPHSGQLPTAIILSVLGLAVGGPGHPGPDAVAAPARLRGRGPRGGGADVADHRVRAAAQPDRPHRRELRRHCALRDPHLGGSGLPGRRRPVELELRHDALLGPERQCGAARAPGGGTSRRACARRCWARAWCCSTSGSTSWATRVCAPGPPTCGSGAACGGPLIPTPVTRDRVRRDEPTAAGHPRPLDHLPLARR